MKTKQFFNLNLNVSLTMNDLYDISDAIFIAINVYKKKGHEGTANKLRELYLKVDEQIDSINNICE